MRAPQIQRTRLPTVVNQPRPTANAFGASEARAIGNLGQGVEMAGEALDSIETTIADATARDIDTKRSKALRELLHGRYETGADGRPVLVEGTGYLTLKGDAALQSRAALDEEIRKLGQESFGSNNQLAIQAAGRQWERRVEQARTQLDHHTTAQLGVYRDSVSAARVEEAKDAILADPYSQETFRTQSSIIMAESLEMGLRQGKTREDIGNDVDNYLSKIVSGAIQGAIEEGDLGRATILQKQHAERLEPEDARRVGGLIRRERERQAAKAEAQRSLARRELRSRVRIAAEIARDTGSIPDGFSRDELVATLGEEEGAEVRRQVVRSAEFGQRVERMRKMTPEARRAEIDTVAAELDDVVMDGELTRYPETKGYLQSLEKLDAALSTEEARAFNQNAKAFAAEAQVALMMVGETGIIPEEYSRANLVENLGPNVGAEMRRAFVRAADHGKRVSEFGGFSMFRRSETIQDEMARLQRAYDTSNEQLYQETQERLSQVVAAEGAIRKQIAEDPAAYAVKADPVAAEAQEIAISALNDNALGAAEKGAAVQALIGARDDAYARLGVPESLRQPLSIQEEQLFSGMLQDVTAQDLPGAVAGVRELAGDAWPRVLSQLEANGEIPSSVRLIGRYDDPLDQRIIANYWASDPEDLAKRLPKDFTAGLKDEVNAQLAPYLRAWTIGTNDPADAFKQFEPIMEAVRRGALLNGTQTGMDQSSAIKRAIETVIGKHYDVLGGDVMGLVPKGTGPAITLKAEEFRDWRKIREFGADAVPGDPLGDLTPEHRVNRAARDGVFVTVPNEYGHPVMRMVIPVGGPGTNTALEWYPLSRVVEDEDGNETVEYYEFTPDEALEDQERLTRPGFGSRALGALGYAGKHLGNAYTKGQFGIDLLGDE